VVLACVILGCFEKFLYDPYYEPLLWFMIKVPQGDDILTSGFAIWVMVKTGQKTNP